MFTLGLFDIPHMLTNPYFKLIVYLYMHGWILFKINVHIFKCMLRVDV